MEALKKAAEEKNMELSETNSNLINEIKVLEKLKSEVCQPLLSAISWYLASCESCFRLNPFSYYYV